MASSSYERYEVPAKTSRLASTDSVGGEGEDKQAVEKVMKMAKEAFSGDSATTNELKSYIRNSKTFGEKGDKVALQLVHHTNLNSDNWPESFWAKDAGWSLLGWLVRDSDLRKCFGKKPANASTGEDEMSDRLPIPYAIELNNLSFLATFLGICFDTKSGQNQGSKIYQPGPEQFLECTEERSKDNCLHLVIKKRLPFAPFMAAVCSGKALTDTDAGGYTPLHPALKKKKGNAQSMPPRPMHNPKADQTNRGMSTGDPETRLPVWPESFDPRQVLEEITLRKDADQILQKILTTTNDEGNSPYQEDLDKWGKPPDFKARFKRLIFHTVKGIPDVSRALYGTSGSGKELCLDMSDFNQTSHDFEQFVDRLTKLQDSRDDSVDSDSNDGILQFEDTLFFVHLPDLNYVKQPCPHRTLETFFDWLKNKKHVTTIKKLNIPDSTINPMNPVFFEQNVLGNFEIEALDWRKLDMNLDILTGYINQPDLKGTYSTNRTSPHRPQSSLKDLVLYSSGNWSVLYHWISKDGLARLPKLLTVRIEIIDLDPNGVPDTAVQDRHRELAREYKTAVKRLHDSNKETHGKDPILNFNYELDIKTEARWYYPPPPHSVEEPTARVPMHHFASQLTHCHKFLDEQKDCRDTEDGDQVNAIDQGARECLKYTRRFQDFTMPPKAPPRGLSNPGDQRIKVAIIDNGADRIRAKIGEMIAKGISYVTADLLGSDRILPWWMVSDSHGTYMASLIGQINPYCRLYIARVGKGRNDIDPRNGAKAIKWALEQKVDVISMSWTTRKDDRELREAIKLAAQGRNFRQTLIFCSTSDEGIYSESIFPADYEEVVRVSATDRWGHLTTRTQGSKPADIQIPGENIEALGASYIGSALPTVSDSSVATALAAGIASFALLLLRTYYHGLNDADMERFYTRDGIKRIFKKMDADVGGVQLSKLFPREATDGSNTH